MASCGSNTVLWNFRRARPACTRVQADVRRRAAPGVEQRLVYLGCMHGVPQMCVTQRRWQARASARGDLHCLSTERASKPVHA